MNKTIQEIKGGDVGEMPSPQVEKYTQPNVDLKTNYWMRSIGAEWRIPLGIPVKTGHWHLPIYPNAPLGVKLEQRQAVAVFIAVNNRKKWWEFWK